MTYKEEFLENWAKSGGLITEATAAKIKNVNRSAISRNVNITKYRIGNNIFVSLKEILEDEKIKPRKKKEK